ncbi:MAG: hypothetical protein P4L73_03190 [Caulobacteraceae bacterium]|nr:hypothetical protein [Caulobacteraceae bacterium]
MKDADWKGDQVSKVDGVVGLPRPVIVTGVPIQNGRVEAPRAVHQRIQDGYSELRRNLTDIARGQMMNRLLSALGTYRYHLGSATLEGRKTSNRMEALRRRRAKLNTSVVTLPSSPIVPAEEMDDAHMPEAPWE